VYQGVQSTNKARLISTTMGLLARLRPAATTATRQRVLRRQALSTHARGSGSGRSSLQLPIVSLDESNRDGAAQLAAAFAEVGCCYLSGHGVSQLLQQRVMHSAQSFCALPSDVKASIPVVQNGQGFTRGFIGIGKESGSADRIEVKEAFSYGYEWPEATTDKNTFANGLQGANVWPDKATWDDAHRQTFNEFYGKMVDASRAVSRRLSETLYRDADVLDSYCHKGDTISIMRLFHYFPYRHYGAPPPDGFEFIGSSPHTDWGFLTLILQDKVGGLQILHKGKWIDVPYVPDTLVVNAGDYLSLTTNGQCVSPVHRVIADDRERYSMVFFFYPDFEAVLPSVSSTRIGGNRGENKSDEVFNNLLDGTVTKTDACFGEYIMAKWAGVQR
jgi:isopenicillin N synthase-like dioxygenase